MALLSLVRRVVIRRVAVLSARLTVGAHLGRLRIDGGLIVVVAGHIDEVGSDMMARGRKAMVGQRWGGRADGVVVRGGFVPGVTLAEDGRHAASTTVALCSAAL